MGIGGIGTTDITTDRIMAMDTAGPIMAMGTVGTTIVGGNPASALPALRSKMM